MVKWFLAILHCIVLAFIGLAVFVCVIAECFAMVFTSRMPRALFDFIVGYVRCELDVGVYAFILTTDKCPTFLVD
ncbi:MAG: DUF4389 domain-containing protein [Chloroflexota bacterium]